MLYTSRGQIVIAFVGMIMAIVLFLLLIVNVSTLSRERIRLQTAADARALAMATFQARALNAITDRNFILKYPSGDQKKQMDPKSGFSFPGIDVVANGLFIFPSKTDFEKYVKVIAPYQRQQDKFLELYTKLIPRIGETYLKKNDAKAVATDTPIIVSFDIKREEITVLYIDWQRGDPEGKANELIDGWMKREEKLLYSFTEIQKKIKVWGESFDYKTTAMATVIPFSGKLWPQPYPQYKSCLTQTEENDEVLH